jgi:hypothetical protein
MKQKSHRLIKAPLAEPEVLKIIGAESRRNGTDRLTSRQIDDVIKTARVEAAEREHLRGSADQK